MSDRAGTLVLADFLPYRLSVLANRISRELAGLYAVRFDLTVTQWRVMAVLGRHPGSVADDVCRRTEMDKVTVSRAVTALKRRGLLRRRADAADRRRVILRLTVRGREMYRQIVPLALAYERRLLAGLTAPARAALDNLLAELDRVTASESQTM